MAVWRTIRETMRRPAALWVGAAVLWALWANAGAETPGHPFMEPIDGSVPMADLCHFRELDAFQFPAGRKFPDGRPEFRLVQGKKWFLSYAAPKEGPDKTPMPPAAIQRHYREFAGDRRGSILYEDAERLYFTVRPSEDRMLWVYLLTSKTGYYNLLILEERLAEGDGDEAGKDGTRTTGESLESMKIHSLLEQAERNLQMGDRNRALRVLLEAACAVGERLPLSVRNVRLVEDTASYRPRGSNVYDPGQPISLTFLLTGHGFRREGPNYRIDITTDFLVLARDGKILGSQEEAFRFSHVSPAPVPEFPVDLSYVLTDAPKGTYTIHTVVRDVNSGKHTKFTNEVVIR